MKTPVLFVLFNRPATTQSVFEAIRKARPEKLFVAADGPRHDRVGELEKCTEARRIATAVDWPCEVKTFFRDQNAGCGKNVSGAITWFFEHVDEGIILEDDCLPSESFFKFCSELLELYKTDERVMAISGNNMLFERTHDQEHSYFFSNHNYIWGWATWKRAWAHYDYHIRLYKDMAEKEYFKNYYSSRDEHEYMDYVMSRTYRNTDKVTTWDYQWDFARKINSGLVIVPTKNLILNLGLGGDATHTVKKKGIAASLQLEEIQWPLIHPDYVMADLEHDRTVFRKCSTTPFSRMKSHIKRMIPEKIWPRKTALAREA